MVFQFHICGIAIAVLLLQSTIASAGLCAFETRVIPSANGKYLLVLLTPKGEREDRCKDSLAEQDRIEAIYSRSGLYRNDGTTELLWPIEYFSTAKDIFVCDDGIHLVVTFLNWDSSISDRGNALEFYGSGNRLATYNENELLACYSTRLVAGNLFGASWPTGTIAGLNETSQTFAFETNWGDAFRFNILTGELVDSRIPWGLKVSGFSIVTLLLFFGWWMIRPQTAMSKAC